MRLRSLFVGDSDWVAWGELARSKGLTRSAWVRRACSRQAELERSIARLEEVERG